MSQDQMMQLARAIAQMGGDDSKITGIPSGANQSFNPEYGRLFKNGGLVKKIKKFK